MSATPSELMTDEDICEVFHISRSTLHRLIKNGPPRKRCRNTGDLKLIRNFKVGGQRRWQRESVEEYIRGV